MELYIHIPYCRQKCRYCDFASYAGRESTMARYVDALLSEARHMASYTHGTPIETVFIGGGTPSLLPPELLRRLLNGLRQQYLLPRGIEFTSEANPGTLTRELLDVAIEGGVNRISMGMQASQESLLRTLGRIHTFEQVKESVELVRAAGISNISLDLMFGLPGQTVEMWRETLLAALSLEPEHISAYGLIPEEGTPLTRDLDAGRLTRPHEEDDRRMYDDAIQLLAKHGFQQYEISNFARPGHACRHNIGYWRQVPYIGLGASAASMLLFDTGCMRTSNPSGIEDYIRMTDTCQWDMREKTSVSKDDMRFETLMLGLRMTQGVSDADFIKMHGVTLEAYRGKKLRSLEHQGLLVHESGWWRLTRRGMDVQNSILVDLMDE